MILQELMPIPLVSVDKILNFKNREREYLELVTSVKRARVRVLSLIWNTFMAAPKTQSRL